ncbi:MAG: HD family phosphohydrolase [Clostridium saudiense]|mgnify:FL=1|uniref:HD family phosphohydrolase n=2 Tax=Clostridiaceae TaxID=31979 RepID=UPI0004BBF8C9|nr:MULTISPECIES: HDIG domain-containing metalloprotein [Clostridium]MDU7452631.1 HDIG domain-containing protein [Clostridium saudiense]MEE0726006.1 HDIG domain-containing protein [Clostridium saudiense]CUO15884.1 metal dependent phosphohydrolase [Clostridium disporicum]SCJ38633.1 phosphodiesterase [uncultured Clostridium sp.]
MKDKSDVLKKAHMDKWKRIFLFTITAIFIYFIMLTVVTPKRYKLNEGDIATVDIKAPRDIIDEEATKAKEQEVTAKVEKKFTLKNEIKIEASENIKSFFDKLINLKSNDIDEKSKISELKKIDAFKLSDAEYKTLLDLNVDKDTELQWIALTAIDKGYEKQIEEDNSEDIAEAKTIVDDYLSSQELESNIEVILREMCESQIKANYFFDQSKTDEAVKEALKSVSKVMIKKNQTIVKEGEPITQQQINILAELGLVGEDLSKDYIYTYIILAFFVLFVLGMQYMYLKKEKKEILIDTKLVFLILLLNLLSVISARVFTFVSLFIIPIACAPILMTVFLDSKISIVINSLNLLFVAVIVGFDPQVILIGIVSTIVSSTTLKKVSQRNDILYSTVYVAAAVAVVILSSGILLSNNIKQILLDVILAVFGAFISGILAMGLLPFLESSFSLVTNMKLLELSNPNNPLLKRLLMEAPGTYHHSVMVANLAEVAAEEVGANPMLVRVGAYYHDVGKIKRPFFFGENQLGGTNPHDKISPTLSTTIIISHVKDGLELAKEYDIPKVVSDMIVQHHGTTLVKYFYYTLKNSSENPDEIREEDFRYPGPKPQSKEAAIIMMADSVEAAVRSIQEPTLEKIEDMVNNIVKDKMNSNQLNECDLTFRELEVIKACFLRVLKGIYHHRIEYPTEKGKE